jgi:1-acyl-sn-glycerol-3-phosphate acyltransferase
MLRNILFYLMIVPAGLILSLTAWLFGARSRWISNASGILFGRLLIAAGRIELDVDLSALDPGRAYIFMVNHQSYLDIPVLFTALRQYDIRYVAKESLFSIPVFGPALREAGHISIDRENRRKAMQSIDRAVAMAQSGISIIIFPEGTRSHDLSGLAEFKIGGIILALKCGCPVVPLVMAGSGDILPRGSLWLRPGRILVRALPPIDAAAEYTMKDRERFMADLRRRMNDTYTELRPCLTHPTR